MWNNMRKNAVRLRGALLMFINVEWMSGLLCLGVDECIAWPLGVERKDWRASTTPFIFPHY
jgi:hypothetical protein